MRTEEGQELLPFPTLNAEFRDILKRLANVGGRFDASILLLGDTGVGKTSLAKKIHDLWKRERLARGSRETGKFMECNCSTFKGLLALSALFGHVEGAFTGAVQARKGILELAHGGTLFLDEVGELEPEAQALLLKAIDEKEVSPLGDHEQLIPADFRLIAATNCDLEEAVERGDFRRDLYMRISQFMEVLPRLRDLPEDMERLLEHELREWNRRNREKFNGAEVRMGDRGRAEFVAAARDFPWPGNHRQFSQVVTRLAMNQSVKLLHGSGEIDVDSIRDEFRRLASGSRQPAGGERVPKTADAIVSFMEEARHKYDGLCLADAAEACLQEHLLLQEGGNKSRACRSLYGRPGKVFANLSGWFGQRRKRLLGRVDDPRM